MLKLSIVIPAYNAENYIASLIKSLYHQQEASKCDYEVIVVNDGSTDQTPQCLQECKQKYGDLQLTIIDQENGGVSSARNKGLYAARGEYVWFIDSDDMLLSPAINEVFTIMRDFDVDVIKLGPLLMGYLDNNGIKKEIDIVPDRKAYKEVDAYQLFNSEDPFFHHRFVWRRSMLLDNCLKYPENISNNEDILFLIKALTKANRAYDNPTMQYYLFRDHPYSLSRGKRDFAHMDFTSRNSLFVLTEAIRYGKRNVAVWSKEKTEAYNHAVDVLKRSAVGKILFGGQSLLFNRYYIKRLKLIGCIPYDPNKTMRQSLRIWVYNTPSALLLASFMLRFRCVFKLLRGRV